jgi:hypothetical protein
MQATASPAAPHQTSARRCVMIRAMKSLMRMAHVYQQDQTQRNRVGEANGLEDSVRAYLD